MKKNYEEMTDRELLEELKAYQMGEHVTDMALISEIQKKCKLDFSKSTFGDAYSERSAYMANDGSYAVFKLYLFRGDYEVYGLSLSLNEKETQLKHSSSNRLPSDNQSENLPFHHGSFGKKEEHLHNKERIL